MTRWACAVPARQSDAMKNNTSALDISSPFEVWPLALPAPGLLSHLAKNQPEVGLVIMEDYITDRAVAETTPPSSPHLGVGEGGGNSLS